MKCCQHSVGVWLVSLVHVLSAFHVYTGREGRSIGHLLTIIIIKILTYLARLPILVGRENSFLFFIFKQIAQFVEL